MRHCRVKLHGRWRVLASYLAVLGDLFDRPAVCTLMCVGALELKYYIPT